MFSHYHLNCTVQCSTVQCSAVLTRDFFIGVDIGNGVYDGTEIMGRTVKKAFALNNLFVKFRRDYAKKNAVLYSFQRDQEV